MRITRDRLQAILGAAPKPARVYQRQFDGNQETLAMLARSDWDNIPDGALWDYIHDLCYMELQPDLFRHLFPACLKFWHDTLMRNQGPACGDADLANALLHGQIMDTHLNATERQAVYHFFTDSFLDRIEAERGFAYDTYTGPDPMTSSGKAANAWIFRFNTLGIVAPVIPDIWHEWWRFDHPGQAVSAVMYASGLVYCEGENPIYLPWNRDHGGGGPYLTETDASIFDRAWREDNLAFLHKTLTVEYLLSKLDEAAQALAAEPEAATARRIAEEAKSRTEIIAIRREDLLANLARVEGEQDHWV